MSTENTENNEVDTTLTEAVAELQKVVSHNAKVTMGQYENLLNGVRLNNLLINAIIRKVGLSAESVKEECDKIQAEMQAELEAEQAKKAAEELAESEEADQSLSMAGGEGDHPEEAIVFGD